MSNNRYGGVDSYAAFFIAYKARTLIRMPMFSRDDLEDLEQDMGNVSPCAGRYRGKITLMWMIIK